MAAGSSVEAKTALAEQTPWRATRGGFLLLLELLWNWASGTEIRNVDGRVLRRSALCRVYYAAHGGFVCLAADVCSVDGTAGIVF